MSQTDEISHLDADNEPHFDSFKLKWVSHSHLDESKRGHTGVYSDYELGEWNYRKFIAWISEHLLTFALSPEEVRAIDDRNVLEKIERAAAQIYSRGKDSTNRGEIGELILHGLIRDIYKTEPMVSKIYYKSAAGDPVKGADCVHAIFKDNDVDSLWLGEAKFYKDSGDGIRDAVSSINSFLDRLAGREEFVVIRNYLGKDDSKGKRLDVLLSQATSLDDIKAKICIPVLITYESDTTKSHTHHSETFVNELKAEIEPLITSFLEKVKSIEEVDIHVFFMPLKDKAALIEMFNRFLDGKRSVL